jgi:putative addiction module CopG family antidote
MISDEPFFAEEPIMSLNLPPDVHQLVQDRLATGNYSSEEEVLRVALRSLADEESDDLRAIQEAIDQAKAGAEELSMAEVADRIRRGRAAQR